jgi:2'-5' RNA ligase
MENWKEWQKPYAPGTFVILPPDDVSRAVNRQREQYDPVSASYSPAHITVTQPLSNRPDQEDWEKIESAMKGFSSFKIDYGPLRSFLPYPCIWYQVQPVKKVLALRESLHSTGLFNLNQGLIENFIPHLTITEGQSGPEVTEALLEELQAVSAAGSFTCKDLAYIVPDPSFRFHTERLVPFGDSGQ